MDTVPLYGDIGDLSLEGVLVKRALDGAFLVPKERAEEVAAFFALSTTPPKKPGKRG